MVSYGGMTGLHICLVLCRVALGRLLTFIPTFAMGIMRSLLQIRVGTSYFLSELHFCYAV